MHREISHVDQPLRPQSNLALYLMTGLIGAIMAADIWPLLASWLSQRGLSLPTWNNEITGYRFALLAAILGGVRVMYTAADALLEGRFGADIAIFLACLAAMLIREPLVAAEIVFIGMVGECLEAFTFERTQRQIRNIVEVFPRRCWILRDGKEERVRTNEVRPGELVVVKPGARIPVDGVVCSGQSAVDESALTGESLPLDKKSGDKVLAGSLNQFGALTIEATAVAEQTVLGRVIELTAKALRDKAPIERNADRLARYFLPTVLGLAALTYLGCLILNWWSARAAGDSLGRAEFVRSVYPALSVLVVACPCPLILATPAALIAALGRLAGTGVLLKGGAALERLASVTAIAFDKTGTLTKGELEFGEISALGDIDTDELLRTAACAEQGSEHPIGHLIVSEAQRRNLHLGALEEFRAYPGAGVVAVISSCKVIVGTQALLEEQGIRVSTEAQELLTHFDAMGQSALLVAGDGKVLGAIGARDSVRPEAAGVVADLRQLGITDIAILTGDRVAAAKSLAAQVGIDEVRAALLPEEKASYVEQRQTQRRVAMVGDGINDAPALARADVGLAVAGKGVDIAAEAGDIVLLHDPLRHLPLLIRLARATVRLIRQNIIVFAIGVNAVGIIVTAWLWPLLAPEGTWYEQGPLAAVIYHQIGSLAVLLNSMRLLWFERAKECSSIAWLHNTLRAFDARMEGTFNLHEIEHWLGHKWRKLLGAVCLAAVAAYTLSGLVIIRPDEIGVLRQFGRLQSDLCPGLHWCWPWPIEEIVRVKPDRIQTVEIGFRATGATPTAEPTEWSSSHSSEMPAREEATMLTGDGNLVELQSTLRYSIVNPDAYVVEAEGPENILRALSEAALRQQVAGMRFASLLTVNRRNLEMNTLARINDHLKEYGGLGIRLDGLAIHDLHPPKEVLPAYYEVANAAQAKERQVNDAEGQAVRIRRQSEADALKLERQAEAAKRETVLQATASKASFTSQANKRSSLPWQEEVCLLVDAFVSLRNAESMTAALGHYRDKRNAALRDSAGLTDFRLFWNTLGAALQGREKIIIDADNVQGRRHLLLMDPESFRVPVPALPSAERKLNTKRAPSAKFPTQSDE